MKTRVLYLEFAWPGENFQYINKNKYELQKKRAITKYTDKAQTGS